MSRHKGIALISVLLIAMLLTMLATGMLSLTRSGLYSLGQYEQRSRAMQACYTGIDYARYRLQADSSWGKSAFKESKTVLNRAESVVEESGKTLAENRAVGRLPLDESGFELRVENNLNNSFELPAPGWSRSGMNVPGRCVMLAVDGQSQGSKRTVEVILNYHVGVGGSIFAGKDWGITLGSSPADKPLSFSSSLPRGNRIKVNQNVWLPDPKYVDLGTAASRGNLQAGHDVAINSSLAFLDDKNIDPAGASGTSLKDNPVLAMAAMKEMKASISTDAPPSPSRFKPEQLKQPSSVVSLRPGTYRFVNHNTVEFIPPGGGTPIPCPSDTIDLGSGASIQLDHFRFMPQGNVEVAGNLTLIGEQPQFIVKDGKMAANGSDPIPVSLALGYGKTGLPLAEKDMGNSSNTKTRLTVMGNLTIEGDMVGNGQLFVKKNNGQGGCLTVEGNSRLSTTRTDGMAVVVEDSVRFEDVSKQTSVRPFTMLAEEFPWYAQRLQLGSNKNRNKTLSKWQGQTAANITEVVGDYDLPDDETVRGLVIPDYEKKFKDKITTTKNIEEVMVVVPKGTEDAPNDAAISASQLVNDYIDTVSRDQGGVTLGQHTRIREFLKSVEFGAPNPALLSVWRPTTAVAGLSDNWNNYENYNASIKTLVANQISAYNQDARLNGVPLTHYMVAGNSYQNNQCLDFMFGGLLYAQKNIYAHIASRFNLLGTMISAEGTVGFDQLNGGRVRYDPDSFEDQFDLSKVGLGTLFFWMAP